MPPKKRSVTKPLDHQVKRDVNRVHKVEVKEQCSEVEVKEQCTKEQCSKVEQCTR